MEAVLQQHCLIMLFSCTKNVHVMQEQTVIRDKRTFLLGVCVSLIAKLFVRTVDY